MVLRLIDGVAIQRQSEEIAASLQQRKRVALHYNAQVDHTQIIAATARALPEPPAVASVPDTLDQVARTILELATPLDPADAADVADTLRDPSAAATEAALARLERALTGRCVIVEHGENLDRFERDEIALAMREQRQHLGRWIRRRADLVTTPRRPVHWDGQVVRVTTPRTPPVNLQNGGARQSSTHWEEGMDVRTFTLYAALEALGEPSPSDDDAGLVVGRGADNLREQLWDALPRGVRTILRTLAVHGRPIRLDTLSLASRFHRDDFDRGAELALWHIRGGLIEVDLAWIHWVTHALAPTELRETHHALANLFAQEVQPGDSSARLAGLEMLEAHRHLLLCGNPERALKYAQYGAELVVGYARDLSLGGHFEHSSKLYEQILERGPPLSSQLRGYVRHYLHYNRAHAQPELEPVAETARGYEASVADWPENAIFWSRTARAWYVADDAARARECLRRARQTVPPHRDKDARLIARTARRLAERDHMLAALEVWDDYKPDTAPARDDQRRLLELLAAGWQTDRLVLPEAEPLFLHRQERFQVLAQLGGFRLRAEHLGSSPRSESPIECVRAFIRDVSAETRALVRALDRDLDDDRRERKRLLLALVDVSASRLDAEAAPTTWVIGRLERDESGVLWLAATGSLSARYEIPRELAGRLVVADHTWLAEVDTGPSGVPRGPVRRLERTPRHDPEEVWRMWRERLS